MEKRYCCANGSIQKRKRRQSNIQNVVTPPPLAVINRKQAACKGSWGDWWSLDTPNDIVRAHIIPRHEKIIGLYSDIDVGDGCWIQNVLVTSLRCW